MPAIRTPRCAECGHRYGAHFGERCPQVTPQTMFTPWRMPDPNCTHCGQRRGVHRAVTLECPNPYYVDGLHNIAVRFHPSNTFTPEENTVPQQTIIFDTEAMTTTAEPDPPTYSSHDAAQLAGNGGVIARSGASYTVSHGGRRGVRLTDRRTGRTSSIDIFLSDSWTVEDATGVDLSPQYDTWCYSCGDGIDTDHDDYNHCDDCEEYFCEDCARSCGCFDDSDYSDRQYGVRAWDYKPEPYSPKGNYPAEPLLGVELEIGGYTSNISSVVQGIDADESHLYMKEDGSIDGVEIVTHPMTLEWSRSFPFNDLLKGLRDNHCYVNDGYGLHVHVSRSAFRRGGQRSAPHQMAWLMFMYRNAQSVQMLARRQESRWAKFGKPRKGELMLKATRERYDDDRYVAVNCNNRKTYELRFFQSTMDETEFHAAIEFADASVEYTRTLKTADILRGSALTWDHFADWVETEDYPHLQRELEDVAENGMRRLGYDYVS